MTRQRAITKLELIRTVHGGQEGWVTARWERSDGSKGAAAARFRLKTADRWYIAQLLLSSPTAKLLTEVPLARIEDAANADPEIRKWIMEGSELEFDEQGRFVPGPRPRLKRPKARRLDDRFYVMVASCYRAAVVHGLPPAKTLAEDSDTPQGTVNRWIATAREKYPEMFAATVGRPSV
jgi:hypothetical protein